MRLTVFNGSPRFKKSSTKIITDQFAEGFLETEGNTVETEYLVQAKDADRFVEVFRDADQVLLAFPLYHDSMPSIVKDFVESLAPLRGREENPRMLFSIHSGFAEACHSRYVERYMRKLASRLGSECAGAILPGSVHRIEDKPAMAAKPVLKSYRELGRIFGETGELDDELVAKLANPERFTGAMLQLMKVLYVTGLGNRGWDNLAKEAGTYEQRLARPYTE